MKMVLSILVILGALLLVSATVLSKNKPLLEEGFAEIITFVMGEGDEKEEELEAEKPKPSKSITINQFTTPSVTNLNLERKGAKLNITWQNKYVTLRGYFYYLGDNSTYTYSEASSYGVTYDYWLNYNTGSSLKFGGKVNVSNAPQVIKDNGFYLVFELIDKSNNTKIRKSGGKVYLDENVHIDWKDKDNPLNQFNVFNKTTVYLTDNGSAFYDSVIYDPFIYVTNVSVGIFNQTIGWDSVMLISNDTDLVGYWNFEENYVLDHSMYGNDGTLVNDAFINKSGLNDTRGLQLDGASDYVDCGNDDSLDIPNATTICAWIYPKGWGESNAGRIIDNGETKFWVSSAGAVGFYNGNGGLYPESAGGSVSLDTWQHACVSRNASGSINMYVNGALSGDANRSAGAISPASTNTFIGSNNVHTRDYNGTIDEVMIYNISLTASEITELYQQSKELYYPSGTYITQVTNLTGNGTVMALNNISWHNNTPDGTNISVSVRTKNHSYSNHTLWYGLEADSNTKELDYSLNHYDGTIYNSPPKSTDCVVSGCLDFDGSSNQHILVTIPDIYNSTLSLWAKWEGGTGWGQMVSGGGTPPLFTDNGMYILSNEWGVSFRNNSVTKTLRTTGDWFQPNTWYHLTVTYNGTHLVRYANGTYLDQVYISNPDQPSGTANYYIGIYRDGSSDDWNGKIDEIMVWNYPLTASNILTLYNAQKEGKENWTTCGQGRNFTNPTLFETNDCNGTHVQSKFFFETNSSETPVLYNYTYGYSDLITEVAPPPDTCDCPTSGNWDIDDGSSCYLSTTCNIATKLRIDSGSLRIQSSGFLRSGGCYVADAQSLYVDDGGGLFCG